MSGGGPAHALFTPTLLGLAAAVRTASARVVGSARRAGAARGAAEADDPTEAVHDFRVALRRLRTLLRPARAVYGKKRVRAVAEELRRFADATGALRDEEVLPETLAALELPAASRKALHAWMARRARQERSRRAGVVRLLRAGAEDAGAEASAAPAAGSDGPLEHALHRLEELTRRRPRPIEAAALGDRALREAEAGVRALAGGDPGSPTAMHALRIRWKRLRYTAELLAPLRGEATHRLAKGAARMQKRLGELHDLDEALARLGRAWGLPPRPRAAVLKALQKARVEAAEAVRSELAEELARVASSLGEPTPSGDAGGGAVLA